MAKNKFFEIDSEVNNVLQKLRSNREKFRGDFVGLRKANQKPREKLKTLKEKQGQILKNKIKNKQFYFKPIKTSTSISGGRNFKADIFMNTRKGLKKVSTAKWNTASYRGEDSEVLNQLVRDKVLPKETLSLSKSSNSGPGYYGWELKDLTGLKIKEL